MLKLEPHCEAALAFVAKAEKAEKARNRGRGEGGGGEGGGEAEDEAEAEAEMDPYEVLGLTSECSAAEIKSAYRKLALKYHPDKHADGSEEARAEAEAVFQQVNLAHTLLSDPGKRRMYDAGGRVRDIMK